VRARGRESERERADEDLFANTRTKRARSHERELRDHHTDESKKIVDDERNEWVATWGSEEQL